MSSKTSYILAIESSCDDTAAAVLKGPHVLSNVVANQDIHERYGGVVPELASRTHQQNIVPTVDNALKSTGISGKQLSAVAYTNGPGLLGSLLVGSSFAKSLSLALDIPLIEVNHMQGHILAHFIEDGSACPKFPFLALTISGGHTQLVLVDDYFKMTILGQTLDDAVGEAFDKSAKILGFSYPGGPLIDKYSQKGNPLAFKFSKPKVKNLDFSFSGLKTNILYFVNDKSKTDKNFVKNNLSDLCASIQRTITDILMEKITMAVTQTGIKRIAIGGGVSANSDIRNTLCKIAEQNDWEVFIPKFEYTTDNAAMIGIVGYFKYQRRDFAPESTAPKARYEF